MCCKEMIYSVIYLFSCYDFDLVSCYMFEANIEWQFASTHVFKKRIKHEIFVLFYVHFIQWLHWIEREDYPVLAEGSACVAAAAAAS